MNFVVSVIHAVTDLASSSAFLCDVLGFQRTYQAAEAIIVENGAVAVRLVTDKEARLKCGCLNLELQTRNLAQAMEDLLALPEISLIAQPTALNPERLESRLQGPHGIIITLAQEFNEDELDVMPPLPASLVWNEDAEDCIKHMLRLTPIGFRGPARIRITERAEMLAAEDASIIVNIDNAVQALADVTPLFQHDALRSALRQRGIDPSGYFNRTLS